MTTALPDVTEKVISVWNDRIRLRVKVAGQGPALGLGQAQVGRPQAVLQLLDAGDDAEARSGNPQVRRGAAVHGASR